MPAEHRKESIVFILNIQAKTFLLQETLLPCICSAFVQEEIQCNNVFIMSKRLNKAKDIHHLHAWVILLQLSMHSMESARSLVNKVTSTISNIKSLRFRSTICTEWENAQLHARGCFSGKWTHCANAIVLQLVYILKRGFTLKLIFIVSSSVCCYFFRGYTMIKGLK